MDLDKIIQENLNPAEKKPLTEVLDELVKEALMEAFGGPPQELTLNEEKKGKKRTYTIRQIPLIPISELGWANNNDDGVKGTQRNLLEDWLRNIKGGTVQEKLNNVQARMEQGFGEIPKTENMKEYIQEVMSYLVFLKTLTMAITNFNASAAGFNFEAFLSALLNGNQIPASGADTIADITAEFDGKRVPVSLKLYREGGLEVGGSFIDLTNDLVDADQREWAAWATSPEFGGGAMRYIAATKSFEEQAPGQSPLERSGTISCYQFDFTRNNVFRLLAGASKHGRLVIGSSEDFMLALENWDKTRQGDPPDLASTLPARTEKGEPEAIARGLVDYLIKNYSDEIEQVSDLEEDQVHAMFNEIGQIYLARIESVGLGGTPAKLGTATNIKRSIANTFGVSVKDGIVTETYNEIVSYFKTYYNQEVKASDKRGEAIKQINFIYGENPKLVEWYEGLSPEAKAIALKNSYGYISSKQFSVPNMKAIEYSGGKPFAQIKIGAPAVQEFLEKVQNEVMDRVFDIFDNMAEMTEKLNSFFANGLKETSEAEEGAEAGEEAAATVRQVAGVEKGGSTPTPPMGAGGTRPLPGAPGRIPMQEEKEDLTSSDEVITLFL